MAKVIMTCGKLCSGKSTYARKLQEASGAVILSLDAVMLALFPEGAGAEHDRYVERAEKYLLELSLQIVRAGTDVILDWGLWTRSQRQRIREFYARHGTENEMHYLRISEGEWDRRIRKRNGQYRQGEPSDYYVDEGLLQKFRSVFQEPDASEADLILDQEDNP